MQVSSSPYPSFLSSRATTPAEPPREQSKAADPAQPSTPQSEASAARARFSVSRFTALLNMSAPERPAMGESLVSQNGARLFAHGPIPGGRGGVHPESKGATYYPAGGPTDVSTEGLVQEMLDNIGDGERITLADARAALALPSHAVMKNPQSTIDNFFDRLDRDNSGALERGEMMYLMKHYQDWDRSQGKPRLPSTWA